MNITDIDDKIIKRARQNHLYENYVAANHSFEKILADTKMSEDLLMNELKTVTDPDKKSMMTVVSQKISKAIAAVEASAKADDSENLKENMKALLKEARDPISNWLDKTEGANISEHSIFSVLSRFWESAFHKDMEALNVSNIDSK